MMMVGTVQLWSCRYPAPFEFDQFRLERISTVPLGGLDPSHPPPLPAAVVAVVADFYPASSSSSFDGTHSIHHHHHWEESIDDKSIHPLWQSANAAA